VRPDGAHYYPAFPYPSFTRITDPDLRDLWAYLRSLAPSERPSRAHDLRFPFKWRWLVWFWKLFFFSPGPFTPDAARSAELNRGAYLVTAPGHCSECHSPRNIIGGIIAGEAFAGAREPDGKGSVPNITPSPDGIGDWSEEDIVYFLETGNTPDYDMVAGSMAAVQRNMAKLTPGDRDAIALYIRSLPPRPDAVPKSERSKAPKEGKDTPQSESE
jgi:mono/diheme cytochrome c family protein